VSFLFTSHVPSSRGLLASRRAMMGRTAVARLVGSGRHGLSAFPEDAMNRSQVLQILADHRAELASEFGVASLALFGSVVRDEATSASDVDLLVEFDGRPVGLFHLSRTQHYLETVLGVPRVDLVLRDAVKPALRDKILREAVYAA